jgi:hypothetical protein
MDNLFSLKGKEALFISGILGIIIFFIFLDGDSDQNKFYYVALGYGLWFMLKNTYWYFRINNIIKISRYDTLHALMEIEKIRRIDKDRADKIEQMIY